MNWCLTWLFFSLSTQTLLSQTREKQASTLSEVTWQGRTVPVKNEPVRLFLLNLQESSQEVEKTEGEENKISIYESILKQCIDAQQVLRDSLQDDQVRYTHQRWQNTLKLLLVRKYILFSTYCVVSDILTGLTHFYRSWPSTYCVVSDILTGPTHICRSCPKERHLLRRLHICVSICHVQFVIYLCMMVFVEW